MTPKHTYNLRIEAGHLRADADQAYAVDSLQEIHEILEASPAVWQPFGHYNRWNYMPKTRPMGFYFYGTVGRGKSMLMNLFFKTLTVPKRRVHFHTFMNEIHERMNSQQTSGQQDPVHEIAEQVAKEAQVLCFDEFYISNIADAMMLGRLFEKLAACGVVICATSNWAPEDLFKDGHNRSLFKPFIAKIQKIFNIISLGDGTDWRRKDGDKLPHVYVGQGHDLKKLFNTLSGQTSLKDTSLDVVGATLAIIGHSPTVLHTTFGELCGKNFAADHYLHLAEAYRTFIIEDIPVMDDTLQDAAMRFVVLIDVLYEHGNALVIHTEKTLQEICPTGESAFAFERTISRIIEMQKRL